MVGQEWSVDFEVQCESCGRVGKLSVDRFEVSDNFASVDIDVEDISCLAHFKKFLFLGSAQCVIAGGEGQATVVDLCRFKLDKMVSQNPELESLSFHDYWVYFGNCEICSCSMYIKLNKFYGYHTGVYCTVECENALISADPYVIVRRLGG